MEILIPQPGAPLSHISAMKTFPISWNIQIDFYNCNNLQCVVFVV